MKFYTSVEKYGSNILVRESVDGIRSLRKDNWKPTLYLKDTDSTDSKFKSLSGDNVREIQPGNMSECKAFIKEYEGVKNFEIFGQLDEKLQYMNEDPTDGWDINAIKCTVIDIETKANPDLSFPKPDQALAEVILITLHDAYKKTNVTFGVGPFDSGDEKVTEYYGFDDEKTMLKAFLRYWGESGNGGFPDVVTGWNSNDFDLPYLIHRIIKILGDEYAKKLSPWGIVEFGTKMYQGKEELSWKIVGVQCLDMLELMKKFTQKKRASWSLGNVALDEIGATKLENPTDSFQEFASSMKHRNTFVKYNVRDCTLVSDINDKLKMIELTLTLAYKAKINYDDVYSPVKMWDAIIHNELLNDNIVVPQRPHSGVKESSIEGAYVKDPVPGMYHDVVSLDALSLYPSIMQTLNISPETFLGMSDSNVELCLSGVYRNTDPDISMGANGAMFTRKFRGIIPKIIERYMVDRKSAKRKMLDLEQEVENFKKVGDTDSAKALGSRIAALDNLQMSLKILLNALYGAAANKGFRFNSSDMAECITMTGQLFLRAIEKHADKAIAETFKVPESKFLLYCDTDSVFFTLGSIIDKYSPKSDINDRIKLCENIAGDKLTGIVNSIVGEVIKGMNVYENKIFFKQEIAADKAIWLGKKKYAARVFSSEGVRYAKPKFKVMGLELVRSSTPQVVRKSLQDSLEVVFNGTEKTMQKYIEDTRQDFMSRTIEEIAFPRGANNLEEYSSETGIYRKGCPIHVRASLLYNELVKTQNLTSKYDYIREGNKIKFIYLKQPNALHENIIAWSVDGDLPKEFGLHQHIDYDLQFEKTFLSAIEKMITPLGWKTEEVSSLDDFF